MKRKIVVGNWKMDPKSIVEAKAIFSKIKRASLKAKSLVVLCPSDVHIAVLAKLAGKGPVRMGAQDVFSEPDGHFTGQVSPGMKYDVGARYAILGHSEKRARGDSNADVSKKALLVSKLGMNSIVCIGEDKRDSEGDYLEFLRQEISESLGGLPRAYVAKSLILAYEPLWTIGRADFVAMKPHDVHETSIFIRKVLADLYGRDTADEVPILYGGSVTSDNSRDIVFEGGVDGLLVGRQSLDPLAFASILKNLDGRR